MFWNSIKGTNENAVAFSLIETVKANHFDPYDYIEYLLEMMSNIDFMKSFEKIDDFTLE